MIFERIAVCRAACLACSFFCCAMAQAQSQFTVPGQSSSAAAEQTMEDFSFSGFGEKGKKSWDLKGKSADIGSEVIKLNDIKSNFYGAEDTVTLTAKKGDFQRRAGSLHLQDDVVVQSRSGTTLTTDSLDWDRVKEVVSTRDKVNIARQDMVITGLGAQGFPDLRKVNLQRDVKVVISGARAEGGNETVITSDGPLQVDYQKNLATFAVNVRVDLGDSQVFSDAMEVYFGAGGDTPTQYQSSVVGAADGDTPTQYQSSVVGAAESASPAGLSAEAAKSRIVKIIARGNVRVVRGLNTSYSEEAVYSAAGRKVTLTGRPKLVIMSAEQFDAPTGNQGNS